MSMPCRLVEQKRTCHENTQSESLSHKPTCQTGQMIYDCVWLVGALQDELMAANLIYWLMVAAFFTHELDAAMRHEWRVLPLTSWMPEQTGKQIFIWLHIPLFFLIFWFSGITSTNGFRIGLSAFAVVHVGLHWFFRKHPAYEFNNTSSWSLILLTGGLGSAYVVMFALYS